MRLEEFERSAIQLNECLLDNRLVLAVTSLHVHHLCDRHTAGYPLICRSREVGNLGKISGVAILDQHECVVA